MCDIIFGILWITNMVTVIWLLVVTTRKEQLEGCVERLQRESYRG